LLWIVVAFPMVAFASSIAASGVTVPSLVANPTAGTAPLNVTFTGHGDGASHFGGVSLEFGDGSIDAFCRPGRACREGTASHTYAKSGAYTASLVSNGEGGSRTLVSVTVVVK
jgi:PKD repeat protein